MPAPTTLVVVNPASAGGRTVAEWPGIRAALDRAGVDAGIHITTGSGDATVVTREALAGGAERVVAVGGDGTLNEVLNGFFSADDGVPMRPGAHLGFVPSGRGGDFRRSVGIPTDPGSAAVLLSRGDVRACDVGRIEYRDGHGATTGIRHFLNIADCGLGGEVVARAGGSGRLGGRATFAWASLRALATYLPKPARVIVDGTPILGRMSNVVIANGRYFGGGMMIAPDACVDDGLLDIVILGDISRVRSIVSLPRVYRGRHLGRPGISLLRGRRIEVEPQDGATMRFDVDGEQVGQAPVVISVMPGAVNLCAPRRQV